MTAALQAELPDQLLAAVVEAAQFTHLQLAAGNQPGQRNTVYLDPGGPGLCPQQGIHRLLDIIIKNCMDDSQTGFAVVIAGFCQ